MKNYYRIMLGKGSAHAAQCFAEHFIGTDFGLPEDLTGRLPGDWRSFNKEYVPKWMAVHPGKSKIAAGLACGFTWTVAKGIHSSDIVLCPDGTGLYRVGEVTGDYHYVPGEVLPHRRPVRWSETSIERSAMSQALRHSAGSVGTVSDISDYRDEIEALLGPATRSGPTLEDLSAFAMEKHLEDFLIANWGQTEFGKLYEIYSEDGETTGQQYQTDTGPIDILAISKNRKELLVVELKKGKASDVAVGQILRYMGYVSQELAEEGQSVRGVIVALEDDVKIRRALAVATNIEFYRYQVSFKLVKA
jgi:restriction system protein